MVVGWERTTDVEQWYSGKGQLRWNSSRVGKDN